MTSAIPTLNHGAIGNGRVLALISPSTHVEWLCLPLDNPYDLEQVSETIHAALEMKPSEVRMRMAAMRRHAKEANVYRWAGNVLSELCEIGSVRAPQPPSG